MPPVLSVLCSTEPPHLLPLAGGLGLLRAAVELKTEAGGVRGCSWRAGTVQGSIRRQLQLTCEAGGAIACLAVLCGAAS